MVKRIIHIADLHIRTYQLHDLYRKQFYLLLEDLEKQVDGFDFSEIRVVIAGDIAHNKINISKLEIWLQSELIKIYPQTEFVFNGIKAINAELDIYIPSLKLAFELNGIFHYEPIFGKRKLEQTKNNDVRKFAECANNNIGLCVIDTSGQKYFKIETSHKYLKIICDIINERMAVD